MSQKIFCHAHFNNFINFDNHSTVFKFFRHINFNMTFLQAQFVKNVVLLSSHIFKHLTKKMINFLWHTKILNHFKLKISRKKIDWFLPVLYTCTNHKLSAKGAKTARGIQLCWFLRKKRERERKEIVKKINNVISVN